MLKPQNRTQIHVRRTKNDNEKRRARVYEHSKSQKGPVAPGHLAHIQPASLHFYSFLKSPLLEEGFCLILNEDMAFVLEKCLNSLCFETYYTLKTCDDTAPGSSEAL